MHNTVWIIRLFKLGGNCLPRLNAKSNVLYLYEIQYTSIPCASLISHPIQSALQINETHAYTSAMRIDRDVMGCVISHEDEAINLLDGSRGTTWSFKRRLRFIDREM